MTLEVEREATLVVTPSLRKVGQASRGEGKGQIQKTPHFQGSCEGLEVWIFNSTDSQGVDKFDAAR
eukprot:7543926-Ditylum_brightwellii.AAC.1